VSRSRGKPTKNAAPRAATARSATPRAAAPDPPFTTESLALLVALAALLAARTVAALVPGMWAWSLNLQRFLDPAAAWGTGLVAALVLVPPVARAAAGTATRTGDALSRGSLVLTLATVAAAAVLVGLLPDVVRFVGDFLIRQGTVEVAEKPSVLFPQALPLDIWLHHTLPSMLTERGWTDANGAARLLGLVEAALMALLGVRLAQLLEVRGAAAWAVIVTLAAGGTLAMYTGFGKAFAELSLLTAWAGVAGLSAIRRGTGLLELGIAIGLAATLHRSGLALVPAAALAWVLWARRHGGAGWRRFDTWAAIAIPMTVLGVMIPRIAAIVRRWDTEHFRPGGATGAALAAQTFTPERFADITNLLMMLVPLLLVVLVAIPAARRAPARSGERPTDELAYLLALALPYLAVMLVLHPAQGMYRDWDDFAATGIALALVAAWILARALRAQPTWVAVAIAVSGLVPTVQWLAVHHDLDRGTARVEAFMTGPPQRTATERATTWDFIGARYFRRGQEADRDGRLDAARVYFTRATAAFASAAETGPSPRILQEWALAATMKGDYAAAYTAYVRLLEKAPDNILGWLGLATVSINRGDLAEGRRGANEMLRLRPGEPVALDLLQQIDQIEASRQPRDR
jgi:hypothetical protein